MCIYYNELVAKLIHIRKLKNIGGNLISNT